MIGDLRGISYLPSHPRFVSLVSQLRFAGVAFVLAGVFAGVDLLSAGVYLYWFLLVSFTILELAGFS